MMTITRKLALPALAAAAALALTGCTAVLTSDGSQYQYTNTAPGVVSVYAPSTSLDNEREFLWDSNEPTEAKETVCATFATGEDPDQQGIALRINSSNGVTTGLTVTRNVIYAIYNVFNFHTWNTALSPTVPETQFAQFTLPFLPESPETYPLNMCARTIGNEMEFVTWTAGQTRPAWGSTTQGGEATIPSDAPATGIGGWYVGHLTSNSTMTMTNMTVDGVLDSDPVG